ncbi:unnamed protein product, partial [Chrysoparadoxa australica]
PSSLSTVAGAGDMPVAISGNLFGMDQPSFDRLVTETMYGRNAGPLVTFTTKPKEGSTENYRVEMLFGAPRTMSYLQLCKGPLPAAIGETDSEGRVKVLAAYCYKDVVQSGAMSLHAVEAGAAGEGFTDMIHAMMTTMFPLKDPYRQNDCGLARIDC